MSFRDLFPGYYEKTEADLEALWERAFFAFDANVLLHLYAYSPATRDNFISVLERLQDRLWLPNQAGDEFHRHRSRAFREEKTRASQFAQHFHGKVKDLLEKNLPYRKEDTDYLLELLRDGLEAARKHLTDLGREQSVALKDDLVLSQLEALFADRVGGAYSDEALTAIEQEAEWRFERGIPPGFRDAAKDPSSRYGDVIIWKQLIDRAADVETPVIFVTDDVKRDWWSKPSGTIEGPHPQLVQEILRRTGMALHMYPADQFLQSAGKYLRTEVDQATIDEVREVAEQVIEGSQVDTSGPLPFDQVTRALDIINGRLNERFDVMSYAERVLDSISNESYRRSTQQMLDFQRHLQQFEDVRNAQERRLLEGITDAMTSGLPRVSESQSRTLGRRAIEEAGAGVDNDAKQEVEMAGGGEEGAEPS
jgi:hypothetical protein